jgi:cytidylate kinase
MSKLPHGWAAANLEARIAAHVHTWEKHQAVEEHPHELYPFITLSREFGCEARPLADRLVEILNERCRPSIPWLAYDRELLDRVANELHLARAVVESLDGVRRNEMSELFDSILNRKMDEALVFRKLAEVVRSLAIHGHVVLVGRGGCMITQDLKTGLHVRLVAPRNWRIHRVETDHGLSRPEAEQLVDRHEKERQQFLKVFFSQDPAHPFHHDLIIDVSAFNQAQVAEIVFTALGARFGEALVGA